MHGSSDCWRSYLKIAVCNGLEVVEKASTSEYGVVVRRHTYFGINDHRGCRDHSRDGERGRYRVVVNYFIADEGRDVTLLLADLASTLRHTFLSGMMPMLFCTDSWIYTLR